MLKKFLTHFFIAVILSVILSLVYLKLPTSYLVIDNKLRDFMFLFRGEMEGGKDVVIVDIDERSLKELGQMPWSRDKFAQMLINMTNAGVGIIGFDIVFPEYDASSPLKVAREYGLPTENLPDFDAIFAEVVANTPTLLGYVFNLEDNTSNSEAYPQIPAIFIEKNRDDSSYMFEPKGIILNIPNLQEGSYSSGFFNMVPDDDGVVRNVPLVMRYENMIFPSLSFEMLRIASSQSKVYINYNDIGVESVDLGELNIPTDRYGRIFVNFRGGKFSYKYISALDIYNNEFDPKDIEGKFILIGTSAAGLLDLRAMPFDSAIPGVEIHANIIDNILKGDLLSKPAWADGLNLLSIPIITIFLSLMLAFAGTMLSIAIIATFGFGLSYYLYYMLFSEGVVLSILFPLVAFVVSFISSTFVNYFLESRQKDRIKAKFSSKVSPGVMEDILKDLDSDVLAGKEREITVFFSDVRNFTNISEAMGNPKNLIEFMNAFMDPMTDIIIKKEGTIDKFMGDAIMAYWNAPQDVKNHADKALSATLEQLHEVRNLNIRLREDARFQPVVEMSDRLGKPILDIGIGLNSGVAIVGEMGSSTRADYTVIGDPINLGARLESLCKFYNSKCNISNFTKELLKDEYIFRFLDLVTVKGKSEPIEIWQVYDYADTKKFEFPLYTLPLEKLEEELDSYHKAIKLYKEANFKDALKIFTEIEAWKEKSNNAVYKMYIERCEHYIEAPPVDFNGVFVHTTKG